MGTESSAMIRTPPGRSTRCSRDVGKVANAKGNGRRIKAIGLEGHSCAVLTLKADLRIEPSLVHLLLTYTHHFLRDVDTDDLLGAGDRLDDLDG